ncbi:MAG: DUF2080 family transposase-associated protein [Candidatus Methanoperedens sp.]|uniref:DUF2080 family transposase-associated protein n=1 Tax=Candidatus Methanoperedens nitratireducens TaxID=1392998 RepID=UPI0012FEC97D|nr:DUF2080 family transposase-associated protein [Candidatus Methanoperedens nitroreducens]MDJ1421234.1 DUF2080 family transposase-associated protein [Candidatus Methanoperedens sp.]
MGDGADKIISIKKKFVLEGYGYQEKVVRPHSETASHLYLPAAWAGKKVAVVLLEQE